jgi:hypothetical protein
VVRIVLRLVAEGGWLSVAYAAITVVALRHVPALDPFELALFTGLGALVAVRTHSRPQLGSLVLVPVCAAAALAGLVAAGMDVSGVFAAVAVVRGAMMERDPDAASSLEGLLITGVPGVGAIWAATLVASQPGIADAFTATALWGTVLFIAAATIAIGLTRLDQIQQPVGDLPVRRAWQLLVVVIGLAIVPLAVPFAVASGIPVAALAAPFVRLAQLLLTLLAIPFVLVATVVLGVLGALLPQGSSLPVVPPIQPGPSPAGPQDLAQQPLAGTLIAIAVIVVAALGIVAGLLLFARWLVEQPDLGGPERVDATLDVERAIVHPEIVRPPEQARPGRRWRVGRPRDAVTAYLAALAELASVADLARVPAETPAGHAARLRSAAASVAAEMGRLAADYQLARYAERPISTRESRRALSRFERVRRLLSAGSGGGSAAGR